MTHNPLISNKKFDDVRHTMTLPITKRKVSYEAYKYVDRKNINKANGTKSEYAILLTLLDMMSSRTDLEREDIIGLPIQDFEAIFVAIHKASNGTKTQTRKKCSKCAGKKEVPDPGYRISLDLNEVQYVNTDAGDHKEAIQADSTTLVFKNPTFGKVLQIAELSVKFKEGRVSLIDQKLAEFNEKLNAEMNLVTSMHDPRKRDRIDAERARLYSEQASNSDDSDILIVAPYVDAVWVDDNNFFTIGELNEFGERPDGIFTIDDLMEYIEDLGIDVNLESKFEKFLDDIPYTKLEFTGKCQCGATTKGELRGISDFFGSYIQ